jgi:RNA polymerase sigma-70 factor, ECF subfamily
MISDRANEELLKEQLLGLIPRLRRFARSLTGDPDKADDLVQSACERALNRLDHVRAGSYFDSWMYRIVYTRWIDRLRRRKTRNTHLSVLRNENDPPAPNPREASKLVAAMDVRRALSALPEERHAALLLICVEGYSYAEAASILNVPAGTVASRVARAREALGRLLYSDRKENTRSVPVDAREGEK